MIKDSTAWWGNLMAVGGELYATDYAWENYFTWNHQEHWYVRYFLNKIDINNSAKLVLVEEIVTVVGNSEKPPPAPA